MKALNSLVLSAVVSASCAHPSLTTRLSEETIPLPYKYPVWGCDGSFSLSFFPQYNDYCSKSVPQDLPITPFETRIQLTPIPQPFRYSPLFVPAVNLPQGNLMNVPNPYHQTQRQ